MPSEQFEFHNCDFINKNHATQKYEDEFFCFHHKNVTVCLPNRRLCHCHCLCVSGEPVPRSLEGLFVYEERSTSPPANDTIVVEQWTVIEVSEIFGEMFVEQRCFIHSLRASLG